MSIQLDFTTGNRQAHQKYKPYPEDDEELQERTRELLRDCVEGGDIPFLKTSAHITELRHRGFEPTSSVENVWLCEDDKP